jgi:hypothetical protein
MDEVNLDEFLKDTASAIDDPEKLSAYLCEKATLAVERFLVRNSNLIGEKCAHIILSRTIFPNCRYP